MEEQHVVELFLPYMRHLRGQQKQRPIFIEAGGFNGIHESNTIHLQRCLGWAGLMVEAQPGSFGQLVANRPGVAALHTAISAQCKPGSSVRFSARSDTSSAVYQKWMGHKGQKSVNVPCGPLQHYLDALHIRHTAFLSIDIEGNELEAVSTIDWSRHSVGVMVIEELARAVTRTTAVRAYLRNHTRMVWVLRNCWDPKVCDSYFVDPEYVDVPGLLAANRTYNHGASKFKRQAEAVGAHRANPKCFAQTPTPDPPPQHSERRTERGAGVSL